MNIKDASQILGGCIEIYDNIIDNSEEIIKICEDLESWEDAPIFSQLYESGRVDKKLRSNQRIAFDQFSYSVDQRIFQMCKTVWEYCLAYSKKYSFGFEYTENVQILKYSPGEYYEPHNDSGPGVNRIVSALLYLNEVDGGGETEFINFDLKITPEPGKLVIFPSNYAYRHAALPPQNGTKYVAVFWMRI